MKTNEVTWTRIRGSRLMSCDRCGSSLRIPTRITVTDLVEAIDLFDKIHGACHEPYLPPVNLPLL
jgi:hypothetical protein